MEPSLEGGVHTDHVDVSIISRTMWANSLASDYAASWLKCYAAGDASACAAAIAPLEHISRAFASEQVSAGTTESQCIRVPDRASLNQPPRTFSRVRRGQTGLRLLRRRRTCMRGGADVHPLIARISAQHRPRLAWLLEDAGHREEAVDETVVALELHRHALGVASRHRPLLVAQRIELGGDDHGGSNPATLEARSGEA